MTLTVTFEKQVPIGGGLKMVIFKVVDSNGNGGTFDVSSWLNHLSNAYLTNITNAVWVSLKWTDGAESITIGSESASGDTYKVTIIGW